jgi:hypothetical protein
MSESRAVIIPSDLVEQVVRVTKEVLGPETKVVLLPNGGRAFYLQGFECATLTSQGSWGIRFETHIGDLADRVEGFVEAQSEAE